MTRPAPVNILSRDAELVLTPLAVSDTAIERVDSLAEMRAVLAARIGPGPVTLDLLGHSSTAARLLRIGRDVIDMSDPRIERFFAGLTGAAILARAGVVAVRLLGCATATTPSSQLTMRRLSSTLGLPVFGTTKSIGRHHYDRSGFDPAFEHLLVDAASLPSRGAAARARTATSGTPTPATGVTRWDWIGRRLP